MSQGRKRKSHKAPIPADTEQQPIGDGVLIRYPGEGKVAISPLGDIKPTELPTLLRQAAQTVERELGV